MKINMPTVNSNVKLITSNQAPTTSNLAKGEMAFGQVGGVNSIYGNTGNSIIKIEFTASGEPIIYFANEKALNTFVEGDDVPESGWYAAIADDLYRFNLKELNGDLVPEWVNSIESGDRTNGWSDVTHKGWWLTVIAHDTYGYGTQTTSTMIFGDDFNCDAEATAIDGTDLVVIKSNCPTLKDSSINQGSGGYMYVTLPAAGGYEFVSGYATNSYEPYEPEPTESYVQFDLSTELPLGNYINSVSFSNRQQVGDYPLGGGWNIDLASGGSNNINISAGASAHSQRLRISVDAWIEKFSNPGYAIPDMNVNITYTGTTIHAISGVYEQAKKRISWNGSFEVTDTGETPAIARDVLTNLWVAIMRYYDTGSPTLRGTIKFEAIDG